MTGVEAIFVDTNILVYANVASCPENARARARLEELASAGSEFWITRQVLREYMAILTRPQAFAKPVSAAELGLDIQRFESQFEIAEDGSNVTARLLDLLNQVPIGGKQIHDANIVATMLTHGVKRLLTHNTTDFRRFASLIEVAPLVPPS